MRGRRQSIGALALAALSVCGILVLTPAPAGADFFDRNFGFITGGGSSGVDLADFKGRYVNRLGLKGKSYADDIKEQPRERVLALTNEYGTIDDPSLLQLTKSVTDKLVAAVGKFGVTNFRPQVVILADPNPGARATPSGVILITYGLLARLESEDQLAFVIGHEIAHVLMRHHDKEWLVKSQRHVLAASEVGKEMADGLAAASGRGKTTGGNNDWHLIADGALIASRDVLSPAWNRSQEDQADLLGVDIMVAAGYQPREVLKVLQVLQHIEFGGAETQERKSAENAYSNLAKRAVSSNQGSPFAGLGRALEGALDSVGKGISEALAEARRSHRSVEERAALIRDYARREYAQVAAAPQNKTYAAALANPRTKQTLQNYTQTTTALQRMVKGGAGNALDPARKGVAAPTERDSYPRLVLSQVLFARGDRKGGLESLQAAIQGPNPALRAYLVLSETHARGGNHKQAWATADAAEKRFQQSEMLLVHRISLHARAGRRNEAQGLAVQCKLQYPALEQACADAARRGVSSVK